MLIQCPECALQVSDKALSCPHCGYPLKPESNKLRKPRASKRKRLPNGFGQITEIKGRSLRKPFRAMVTIGKTPEGKPICKLLKPQAYFSTYNEAYSALMEYNKNPFDLAQEMTVESLYARWSEAHYKKISRANVYKSAWKYCSSVYNVHVRELRARHIRYCMYEGTVIGRDGEHTASDVTRRAIKSLFDLMLDYAVEYELTDKNYSRTIKCEAPQKNPEAHICFSDEELQTLWNNVGKTSGVDLILIQCYTGLRPQELGNIRLSDVHIDEQYMVGGMKTEAGRQRIIPIHHSILNFIKAYYNTSSDMASEYLFNVSTVTEKKTVAVGKLSYRRYAFIFAQVAKELNLNQAHRPHDGRVQFATMAKKYKMDEFAIKHIMGHQISDITEAVYTKRDPKWLLSEIEKIKIEC